MPVLHHLFFKVTSDTPHICGIYTQLTKFVYEAEINLHACSLLRCMTFYHRMRKWDDFLISDIFRIKSVYIFFSNYNHHLYDMIAWKCRWSEDRHTLLQWRNVFVFCLWREQTHAGFNRKLMVKFPNKPKTQKEKKPKISTESVSGFFLQTLKWH